MVTTDGFLHPNAYLTKHNILNRKGFPESYDMELLLEFLDKMKTGEDAEIPMYSHEIYDIIPDERQVIKNPDFLIVEGINVFQNPKNNHIYMSDYFDFSIYIDADSNHIEDWYIERFERILDLAKADATSFYSKYAKMPRDEAITFAKDVWKTINLENLKSSSNQLELGQSLFYIKQKTIKLMKFSSNGEKDLPNKYLFYIIV